ncbi:MAG: beta-ketoacyl-[acyl-carrier-protein] synthase family protein [Polyangiales bacterium]
MSGPHRVVVTGTGAVTPLGCEVRAFGEALRAGRSGVGPVTRFDARGFVTRIAAEVKLAEAELEPLEIKTAFAVRAARDAMTQGQLNGTAPGGDEPARALVSLGVGLELFSMDDLVASRREGFALPEGGLERYTFMQTPADLPLHLIAERYGCRAGIDVHVSACAAGTDAIGAAFRAVRRGAARWALCGGTDSMINPLGFAGFCTLDAMSRRNDEPERASRPFDRTRDGFVLGEGAGVLLIERLEDALARGATVLAEILGYGNALDAHAITEPHPQGAGALSAMRRALADAKLTADAIDAVNAHGTSTPKNDPAETAALRALLGERATRVPVVSTKSMIGHLISAAGAVEAIAAIDCMNAGVIHPTINCNEPDPACDLDYVTEGARAVRQGVVLSCSYGFGGMNAALVLGHRDRIEGALR